MPVVRVGIYARVSLVGDREETLVSPDVQLAECRRIADARGWIVDENLIVTDLDVSAYKIPWSKRPGFSKLIEGVRRHEINGIICYRQDRIIRRGKDLYTLIDELA